MARMISPQPTALHARYLELTGLDVPRFTMRHHFIWEIWISEGYTMADLEAVIAYIKRKIQSGDRKMESFKFSLLIQDTARFADDLAMSRAEARQKRPVDRGRAEVLKATGRAPTAPERPKAQPEQVAEIVQRSLAEFRKVIQ